MHTADQDVFFTFPLTRGGATRRQQPSKNTASECKPEMPTHRLVAEFAPARRRSKPPKAANALRTDAEPDSPTERCYTKLLSNKRSRKTATHQRPPKQAHRPPRTSNARAHQGRHRQGAEATAHRQTEQPCQPTPAPTKYHAGMCCTCPRLEQTRIPTTLRS